MDTKPYDLIVIGSGPAGEKGAAEAAYFGKSVAVIEKEHVVGGAGANTGTLPSKTLRDLALSLGIPQPQPGRVEPQPRQGRDRVRLPPPRTASRPTALRVLRNLGKHKVDLFRGASEFVDAHTVSVTDDSGAVTLLHGEVILIAVGSSPHRPPQFAFDEPKIYDSDEILRLEDIPSSMLVVGGGVIGCEYACTFAILGVKVTVVEIRDRLLEQLDHELTDALRAGMESIGVKVYMGDCVGFDPERRVPTS